MRESRTSGSERGLGSNPHSYSPHKEGLSVMITSPREGEVMRRTVRSADGSKTIEITAVLENGELRIEPALSQVTGI